MHFICDSIIHLMHGQVFDIAGKRVFAMGGASSRDIDAGILEPDDPDLKVKRRLRDKQQALYRINHVSWWKEELPNDEEYEIARQNLENCKRIGLYLTAVSPALQTSSVVECINMIR